MKVHWFFNEDTGMQEGTLRTKHSHPYSYDPITQFVRDHVPEDEKVDSAYTDRLLQWDTERFYELRERHFGNQGDYWDNRSPEAIESFLKDYFNSPYLLLARIEEHCNQASGYPVWYFEFVGRDTSNDA